MFIGQRHRVGTRLLVTCELSKHQRLRPKYVANQVIRWLLPPPKQDDGPTLRVLKGKGSPPVSTRIRRRHQHSRCARKGLLRLESRCGILETATASDHLVSRKSLAASGAAVVGQEFLPDPAALGQPATGLLDVLPTVSHGSPLYAFLQQSARTNNAAVVASGRSSRPRSIRLIALSRRCPWWRTSLKASTITGWPITPLWSSSSRDLGTAC
jgi:hypothetical protein